MEEDQPGRPALVPSRLAVRTLGRPASLGRPRANKTGNPDSMREGGVIASDMVRHPLAPLPNHNGLGCLNSPASSTAGVALGAVVRGPRAGFISEDSRLVATGREQRTCRGLRRRRREHVPRDVKIVQTRTCRRSSTFAKAKPAREVVVGLIASELHLVYLFG